MTSQSGVSLVSSNMEEGTATRFTGPVIPSMCQELSPGQPGGERRRAVAQLAPSGFKLGSSEMDVRDDVCPTTGGNTEDDLPYRFGPSDRPMDIEWLGMGYRQITMDARTFVRLNDGKLTIRGLPWQMPIDDEYEPYMSNRTMIQYWFDDLSQARLGHVVLKLEPNDKPNIRISCPNWISPWGSDSVLSDYKMEQVPEGTVTIGFLRPLKRDYLGNGYWRKYETLPTRM